MVNFVDKTFANKRMPWFDAPMASGKSSAFIYELAKTRRVALIVPTVSLANSAFATLQRFFRAKNDFSTIGKLAGTGSSVPDSKVVVATIGHCNKFPSYILVFDEVHSLQPFTVNSITR
jgi:superfamily II DNA or RNA helicase